jgi:recombination protein RecA
MADHRALTILEKLRKTSKIENLMMMGEDKVVEDITRTSTGLYGFDKILGGGLPWGRMIETIGNSSSGKTTISLEMIRSVQQSDGICAFIDCEHALDISWAAKIGVDVNHLLIQQPDHGEQAIETLILLAENLRPGDLIVLDSVAALVPKAELEGDVSDAPMAGQARLVSKAMRLLVSALSKSGVMINFINQYRQKFNAGSWGEQKKGAGGDVLPFFCSIRLDVANMGKLKVGEEIIGQKVKVKTIKNKTAAPFREWDCEIRFSEGGIPKMLQVFDAAVDMNIISKNGAHFTYNDLKLGHGRDNAVNFLRGNKELSDEIDSKIRAILFPARNPV